MTRRTIAKEARSLKGQTVSPIFSNTLNSERTYLNGGKHPNTGLFNSILLPRSGFHSSVAAEGYDGNGLQLEEIGQFFQVPSMHHEKKKKWLKSD